MLFSPPAHEPLLDTRWEPDRVRAAIREIVEDAEGSFDDGWPNHPQDDDGERRFRTVYLGAAGVVQALDSLQRRALVELRRDYVPYLERTYEPDFPDTDNERSLWMGESAIRLVLHRLSPSPENADRLAELISANAEDERREVMWGSPRNDARRRRHARPDRRGQVARALGRKRGLAAGSVGSEHGPLDTALLREGGAVHRPCTRVCRLHARACPRCRRRASWPCGNGDSPLRSRGGRARQLAGGRLDGEPAEQRRRIDPGEWCHGAPGVVASLASWAPDDDEHGRLLRAGGELTWRAGPLAKGANLCHGTAGNGYAFLALFERTGDELWLERARAFAMHSIAPVTRGRADLGRGRYTLWTGDPGTALYLADCLSGGGAVPLPW